MSEAKFKPQYRRLIYIDQEIRRGKFPNCTQLAQEWEVSPKTIQRDIEYLKYEHDAPIEYDAAQHGFYYQDQTWFLPSVLLSEGDLMALLIGSQALSLYEGTPVADTLRTIFNKIDRMLPEEISVAPELVFSRFSFASPPARPIDGEAWRELVRGLLHQKEVQLHYQSLRARAPRDYLLHPYHLANLEGDWYVFGYVPDYGEIRQFALSRIHHIELLPGSFTLPDDFDGEELLQRRAGKFVHSGEARKTFVRLRFAPQRGREVSEREWHPEQSITRRRDGSLDLRLPVLDLRDVLPWILSFGPEVEVLSPRPLRQLLAETLNATREQYDDAT